MAVTLYTQTTASRYEDTAGRNITVEHVLGEDEVNELRGAPVLIRFRILNTRMYQMILPYLLLFH